jgi:hypothetical protein
MFVKKYEVDVALGLADRTYWSPEGRLRGFMSWLMCAHKPTTSELADARDAAQWEVSTLKLYPYKLDIIIFQFSVK